MNMKPEILPAITIERLTNYTCKWPMWPDELRKAPPTEEAHYCGKRPLPDLPYCKHHMNIARRIKKDD
jgi:hypothetical protein